MISFADIGVSDEHQAAFKRPPAKMASIDNQ
jgi:hypothetical protein